MDALRTLLSAVVALASSLTSVTAASQKIDFDQDPPGVLPAAWRQGVTGAGAARWVVRQDPSAPSKPHVLEQSATGVFPWCVLADAAVEDGFVEVKFKALAGKEDQAGGVVWRWKDGQRYYVARANALENNVSLYYTDGGRRHTLKYVDAPVPPRVWHTLRVEFSGPRIAVSLNDKVYITFSSDHIRGPGAVGLWTKADSLTVFDDFSFGAR